MRHATFLAAALFAAPAFAYQPPNGCEALATVRMNECVVWHVMACADRPAADRVIVRVRDGEVTEIGVYAEGFAGYLGRNAETQFEYYRDLGDAYPNLAANLSPGAANEVEYTVEIASGIGGEMNRFELQGREIYKVEAMETQDFGGRQVAYWRVFWANHPVEKTYLTQGNDYYWPEIGGLIGAISTTQYEDGTREKESETPHSLSLPGEPGFLMDDPAPGCAQVS